MELQIQLSFKGQQEIILENYYKTKIRYTRITEEQILSEVHVRAKRNRILKKFGLKDFIVLLT